MLSADLTEIGAGVSERDGVFYYVIDCARPTGSGAPQAYTPGAESAYSEGLNEIIVPVAMSTPNEKGEIVHEVKSGQSLWQIAIAYGVKINDIRGRNQLATAYLINPGDTLIIKTVETPTPQVATALPMTPSALATAPKSTPIPTELPTQTPTTTPAPPPDGPLGAGGAALAIILVSMAAAGFVAWAGRGRPV
jgi:LysM repeat protein